MRAENIQQIQHIWGEHGGFHNRNGLKYKRRHTAELLEREQLSLRGGQKGAGGKKRGAAV